MVEIRMSRPTRTMRSTVESYRQQPVFIIRRGSKIAQIGRNFFTRRPEYDDFDTGGCSPGEPAGPLKKQTGITKLKQATDGLSHTIMWSPDAGRPDKYEDGHLVPGITNVSGSRWASPDTEYWSHNICAGGQQMFNCHNDNETYSFHNGGDMFSFADGSVHFVGTNIDIEVQVSLHTRAGEDSTAGLDF